MNQNGEAKAMSNIMPFRSSTAPADINLAGLPGVTSTKGYRAGTTDNLTAALNYSAQGLTPIPIEPGSKKAKLKNWQNIGLDETEYNQYWNGSNPCGVALPLGGRSKGLIDLDLDWPQARALADDLNFIYGAFLAFGRKSAPRSHRICFCPEAIDVNICKTIAFAIPGSVANKLGLTEGDHAANVLEVRGNGGYTIFPPTIHGSGERIEWDDVSGRSLQHVAWNDVLWSAGLLAFLSFMMRFYPPVGMRNDFNLALGGALIRALREKFGEDELLLCEQVDMMVTTVCRLAGDQGHGASWEKRAANTLAKIKAGTQVTGLPKLLEIIGAPELDKVLRKWLGANPDERLVIDYDDWRISEVLDRTERAVLARGQPIYQAGGRVVHAVRFDNPNAACDEEGRAVAGDVRRAVGSLQIREVAKYRLKEYFNEAAIFKKRQKGVVLCSPPMALIEHYLGREGEWQLPVLTGIAETPTLRSDGSLVDAEGFDAASGLLLDFGGVKFPQIPPKPTKEQATLALAALKAPLKDFPFVPDSEDAGAREGARSASRSVALSAILTPLVRTALRARPIHVHTAPAAGTGKSLLVDVESIIATGKVAAVMAQGGDEAEDEKRLAGVLLQGDILANIDNVVRPLGGALLCQVLTQESAQVRVLGRTGQCTVPCKTFFTCTGNNVVLLEDLTRRAVVCKLDAKMEAPESREFAIDLKQYVTEQRPQLVAAALTILRAFAVDGCPQQPGVPAFGSFEDWSRLVRGALIWLGEPDPCATRAGLASADPERTDLAALMTAVRNTTALGLGRTFRSGELLGAAESSIELRNVLQSLFPRGPNSKGITIYLRKHIRRIVNGHMFVESQDSHAEAWQFTLRQADSPSGTEGRLR